MARLRDGFGLVGHQCLVLERLRPSLLGLIAESAELAPRDALRQLRGVAFQLLVSALLVHSIESVSDKILQNLIYILFHKQRRLKNHLSLPGLWLRHTATAMERPVACVFGCSSA